MLKLLKMDLKLSTMDRPTLFKGTAYLTIMCVLALQMEFLFKSLLILPIFLVLPSSFELGVRESVVSNYSLIQSLPVKRWEFVISKYLAVLIKHGLIVTYMMVLFMVMKFLGLDKLQYMNISIREVVLFWIIGYLIAIPLMFLFLGVGRVFIFTIMGGSFSLMLSDAQEGRGVFAWFIENPNNIKPIILILLMILISICLSMFFYNNRDLA